MKHIKTICRMMLASFLIVSTLCAHDATAYIVFIHLGDTIPEHLFDAVSQAHLFNDTIPIIVIAEQQAINRLEKKKAKVAQFIPCEQLIESKEHARFKQISSLDRRSHGGLWFKAAERFFYLDELIQQYQLQNVFHMEYDNMLYVDLMTLLPTFKKYHNIAATFDCDNRCIAGFMYIAQPTSLHKLISFFVDTATTGYFEMEIIAAFRNSHTRAEIDHLPIIMQNYVDRYQLRSTSGRITRCPHHYTRYSEEFNSIFDAAALGQFLGGISPRNGGGHAGFINETCLFDPSKLVFEWRIDDQGRKVPYASCGDTTYRINNLHIHSKNLKAFAS